MITDIPLVSSQDSLWCLGTDMCQLTFLPNWMLILAWRDTIYDLPSSLHSLHSTGLTVEPARRSRHASTIPHTLRLPLTTSCRSSPGGAIPGIYGKLPLASSFILPHHRCQTQQKSLHTYVKGCMNTYRSVPASSSSASSARIIFRDSGHNSFTLRACPHSRLCSKICNARWYSGSASASFSC